MSLTTIATSPAYSNWFSEWFVPTLAAMEIAAVSWEDVASAIEAHDGAGGGWFREFYDRCLFYNRLAQGLRKSAGGS